MSVRGSWVGSKLPPVPELPALEDNLVEPEVGNRWATFGNWQLVGNGGVTNERCGTFFGVKACSRVELHNRIKYAKVIVDGKERVVRTTGKVDRKIVLHYCNKPSCSVCYKDGGL